jgi:hypothetical protein
MIFRDRSQISSKCGFGSKKTQMIMDGAPADEIEPAISELEARGLTVEKNEAGILLAVDVPPSVAQHEIDAHLTANETAGRWQMQDGYLGSIETTLDGCATM